MFGCIVAGRLIQTNLEQVGEHQYVFKLENSESINHIVVFLLGTIPFNPGFAATVHFKWPGKDWLCLGILSNEKPSAIFKLKSSIPLNSGPNILSELGISIEPISSVEATYNSLNSGLVLSKTTPILAENNAMSMLQSLYDYCMSFVTKMTPNMSIIGAPTYNQDSAVIPVKAIEDWYKVYTNKIKRGAL
ncbi:Protein OPI10-like protein [Smittium mucronatum]|uniref:Protein OPI10-like protein n=1 Tax=Smittium mucronatum TaxID=133383 RepID=A0A1R0GUM5_9FUNG|nr:Protein OPI10-like protein [Smittium mucronatum]